MRLATVRVEGRTQAAAVDDESVHLLPFPDLGSLLAGGGDVSDWRYHALDERSLSGVEMAPVVMPDAMYAVGLNFRSHILEMGRELPSRPTIFTKHRSTLIGAHDAISLDDASERWDYEAELAVVVGRAARRVTVAEATEVIAGYCVTNDVTARDWQNHGSQWTPGKNFEGTAPLGPVLTTRAAVTDLGDRILSCHVDGQRVQRAPLSDLLFGPPEVVAYLSTFVTLRPGDVIAMGTPAGVAAGGGGPWLRRGSELRTEVEGLGACRNLCATSAPS